jgi:hypothetical protein
VRRTLSAMRDRLGPEGRLFISLRDYGPLMKRRPAMTPPVMFSDDGFRRIVHQVWDWQDERRYVVHLYITHEMSNGEWITRDSSGCGNWILSTRSGGGQDVSPRAICRNCVPIFGVSG